MDTCYVVRFDFPEGEIYAGLCDGAWGFAPTVATAHRFTDANGARRIMENGYGDAARSWAHVVPLVASRQGS